MTAPILPLLQHFSDLTDPRVERTKRHKLLDIIGLTICAVIGGADDFVHVEAFGKAKLDWLRGFLDLPNGIPSHDTLGRVFALLDGERFAACFSDRVAAFAGRLGLRHVAIDGKTLRGSLGGGKAALHTVSAWATGARLTLGLADVDGKSNEITAIPKPLEALDLEGALVTIDAIGCQEETAAAVRQSGADYVLAVKGNQGRLYEDVEGLFDQLAEADAHGPGCDHAEVSESGHGRQETREVWVLDRPDAARNRDLWEDLRSLIVALRSRTVGEKTSSELSYYISSRMASAKEFADAIRGHWGIENGCHWVLDVAFREDDSRIRTDHAPSNMACMRRMALAMLKRVDGAKGGIETRRLTAGWDTASLERVLQIPVQE